MQALYLVSVWDRFGYLLGTYYTVIPYPWTMRDLEETVPEYMVYSQMFEFTASHISDIEEGETLKIGVDPNERPKP